MQRFGDDITTISNKIYNLEQEIKSVNPKLYADKLIEKITNLKTKRFNMEKKGEEISRINDQIFNFEAELKIIIPDK